jgi:hypothetical protein
MRSQFCSFSYFNDLSAVLFPPWNCPGRNGWLAHPCGLPWAPLVEPPGLHNAISDQALRAPRRAGNLPSASQEPSSALFPSTPAFAPAGLHVAPCLPAQHFHHGLFCKGGFCSRWRDLFQISQHIQWKQKKNTPVWATWQIWKSPESEPSWLLLYVRFLLLAPLHPSPPPSLFINVFS